MQLDDIRLRKPHDKPIGEKHTFDWRNGFYYCAKCGGARQIVGDDVTACKKCDEPSFCLTTNVGVNQLI